MYKFLNYFKLFEFFQLNCLPKSLNQENRLRILHKLMFFFLVFDNQVYKKFNLQKCYRQALVYFALDVFSDDGNIEPVETAHFCQ